MSARNTLGAGLIALLLLLATSPSLASTITLAFSGHITSLETDGGTPLPEGVGIGTDFTGWMTYSFLGNVKIGLDDVYNFYMTSVIHTMNLNIGGHHLQASGLNLLPGLIFGYEPYTSVQFFDNYIDDVFAHDIVSISFEAEAGNTFFTQDNSIVIGFLDSSMTAFDEILLHDDLPQDWRIPLDLFDLFELYIHSTGFYYIDPQTDDFARADYFTFRGEITEITEIPLPAAGPLFGFALAVTALARRRLALSRNRSLGMKR